MWITYGVDWFGKVYYLPGQFAVETRFFHFGSLPILPLKSYLLLKKPDYPGDSSNDPGSLAIPIGILWKSVRAAWWRSFLWSLVFLMIAPVLFGLLMFISPGNGERNPMYLYIAICSFVLLLGMWKIAEVVAKLRPANRMQLNQLASRLAARNSTVRNYILDRIPIHE